MLAKEIKNGQIVNYNGAPHIIEKINVQSPSARGAATLYKYKARNLINKQKVDITLKGSESLDEADFQRRSVKYMFADATHLHFLDQTDYDQFALARDDLADEVNYLTEDLEGVFVLMYNNEPVGLQLPLTVELKIIECEPGVKGNSATSRSKPAVLETGLRIQVPEYIKQDETIKIDTRTGEYLSRA